MIKSFMGMYSKIIASFVKKSMASCRGWPIIPLPHGNEGAIGRSLMSKTYVAAYDGSEPGRRAVDFAVGQAKAAGAKLIVAHILEWSPYSFLTPEEIEERHKRRGEELERAEKALLAPLMATLKGSGVEVSTIVKFGHIAQTLCDIANETGAERIIIGRTGQSSIATRIFGSVAGTLAQIAPVPCTIVP
jgi:nucleotide-binding universal stress UspA family protein